MRLSLSSCNACLSVPVIHLRHGAVDREPLWRSDIFGGKAGERQVAAAFLCRLSRQVFLWQYQLASVLVGGVEELPGTMHSEEDRAA